MDKSTQDVIKQLEDPGNIISKTENIDPLAMVKKSLFIGENMATFSSAASYKIYRRSQIDLGIATKRRGRNKYRCVVHIEIVYFIGLILPTHIIKSINLFQHQSLYNPGYTRSTVTLS